MAKDIEPVKTPIMGSPLMAAWGVLMVLALAAMLMNG